MMWPPYPARNHDAGRLFVVGWFVGTKIAPVKRPRAWHLPMLAAHHLKTTSSNKTLLLSVARLSHVPQSITAKAATPRAKFACVQPPHSHIKSYCKKISANAQRLRSILLYVVKYVVVCLLPPYASAEATRNIAQSGHTCTFRARGRSTYLITASGMSASPFSTRACSCLGKRRKVPGRCKVRNGTMDTPSSCSVHGIACEGGSGQLLFIGITGRTCTCTWHVSYGTQ